MRLDLATPGAEVRARTAGRLVASRLRLPAAEQTRTAVLGSELARVGRARGLPQLTLRVRNGYLAWVLPADGAVEPTWSELADDVVHLDDELVVRKQIVTGQPDGDLLSELQEQLLTADPAALAREVQRQNAELKDALVRQKQAEAALEQTHRRLSLALDAARLGMWERGPDGWSLSDRARRIVGLPPGVDDLAEALCSDQRPAFRRAVQSAYTGTWPLRHAAVTESGATIELRATVDGDTLVGTVIDVTDRVRREQELESRAELRQRLMGMASHDLRSPLAVLRSGLALLAVNPATTTGRLGEVRQRMESAVDSASEMIRAMLDLTAAELGGGIQLQPRPAQLHELVDDVIAHLRLANPDADLVVCHQGDSTADVDTARMRQVMTNLVDNALQHTTGTVTVRTVAGPDQVVFEVENPGPEILPETLERIFEPMVQGRRDKKRGLGLGLYIVEQIVQGHGGIVDVRSTAGTTTFRVVLPRIGTPPR